jgi:biopolymer transport protein ExbD
MRQIIPCLMLALAISMTGCATTPAVSDHSSDSIALTLTASGTILLNGRETPPDRLAKRLRSAGATLDTPISIDIAADTPLASVSEITRRLASAGYRKILFKRPKHTAVSSQTTRSVAPAPSPQP